MAINRISEIDLFNYSDLSQFLSTDSGITDSSKATSEDIPDITVFDDAKLSVGLWMEVSTPLSGLSCTNTETDTWNVKPVNEAPSYYLSKRINLVDLSKAITWKFTGFMKSVLSGPTTYIGTQSFGEAIASATDTDDSYWYDSRETVLGSKGQEIPNRLCVMVSADFTNKLTVHDTAYFHSDIVFPATQSNQFQIILDQKQKTYQWNDIDVAVKDYVHSGDLIVQRNAYINNLSTANISSTSLTVSNPINGVCLSARWADLAEKYDSDFCYSPGTLVCFGGEKEITLARKTVNAVVTSEPGVVLDGHNTCGTRVGIALVGKVPVRIVGKVNKFDKIGLSKIPGVGRAISRGKSIGISLESSDIEKEKLVMCVVQLIVN